MSLDKIFLIIFCVIAGAAAIVGAIVLLVMGSVLHPLLLLGAVLIVAFALYVLWRLLSERLGNPEEDHYDGMKH